LHKHRRITGGWVATMDATPPQIPRLQGAMGSGSTAGKWQAACRATSRSTPPVPPGSGPLHRAIAKEILAHHIGAEPSRQR
jgi:hypothetical protein